jgi:hypothetical protein
MEAILPSETSELGYDPTRCNNTEVYQLNDIRHKSLKKFKVYV